MIYMGIYWGWNSFIIFLLFAITGCTQPLRLKPNPSNRDYKEIKSLAVDVSNLGNQILQEDQDPLLIPFTISGQEADPSKIVIKAESTNPNVISEPTIEYIRESGVWGVMLTPNRNAFGETQIRIRFYNGYSSQEKTFQVTVQSVNDVPMVQGPNVIKMVAGKPLESPLEFWVSDVESSEAEIITQVRATQTSVFPEGSLEIQGDTKRRKLFIKVPPQHPGKVFLVLEAKDPEGAIGRFDIEVDIDFAKPQPPSLENIKDVFKISLSDKSTYRLAFTVKDPDSLPAGLSVNLDLSKASGLDASNLQVIQDSGNYFLELRNNSKKPLAPTSTKVSLKVSDGTSEIEKVIQVEITP